MLYFKADLCRMSSVCLWPSPLISEPSMADLLSWVSISESREAVGKPYALLISA